MRDEGLLVLEPNLSIRSANRSFCSTFAVAPAATIGRKLYAIGNGQWDIPTLRAALEDHTTVESFEVDHVFPSIGRRVMILNARKVYQPGNNMKQILLAIEDVTERLRLEREHAAAHERIAMLIQELTHRVKNSPYRPSYPQRADRACRPVQAAAASRREDSRRCR